MFWYALLYHELNMSGKDFGKGESRDHYWMVHNYCIAPESPCQQQVCGRDVYFNQNLLDFYQLREWCYRKGSFSSLPRPIFIICRVLILKM